jgi:hypothetical protein
MGKCTMQRETCDTYVCGELAQRQYAQYDVTSFLFLNYDTMITPTILIMCCIQC